MPINRLTHTGTIRGVDNRTPDKYTSKVRLRETPMYWVSETGEKFRKATGWSTRKDSLYEVVLSSIQPLDTEEPTHAH